jgi:FkbM family methyltransferase
MVSSALRAGACATVLLGAAALSKPEELSLGQDTKDTRLPKPWPADLGRWMNGPLSSEAGEFHRAEVRSPVGDYNLTVAAFDRWTDQGVSGEILSGSGWETSRVDELCQRYLSGGAVGNFLDVGANVGSFTIPLADCLRSTGGRVFAVEGMPPTADHLALGIMINKLKNVDMFTYAVGAPGDPKKVTMSLNPVNKGGSTVKGNKPFTEMSGDQLQDLFHPSKRERMYAPKVAVKEYEVQSTTGDLMLKYNSAMKAIMIAKVDIEGHEGHFLKGSSLLFSNFPPCIMTIELIPEWLERAGTPVQEVIDMLSGWGYTDVPSAAQLKKLGTRTMTQADMKACVERVRLHAGEATHP